MKLLLDAGNSRLKWAFSDGKQLGDAGSCGYAELGVIAGLVASGQTVIGAAVCGAARQQQIEAALGSAVAWQTSPPQALGLSNPYREPARLGIDRFLAVLAAQVRYPQQDVVVALAGTALTVEALSATRGYLGGLIIPGRQLMLGALASKTAYLDLPASNWMGYPDHSEAALASGALEAMLGAIERMRARLAAEADACGTPLVLLSGGDAPLLAGQIAAPYQLVDNLVLYGLMRLAFAQ